MPNSLLGQAWPAEVKPTPRNRLLGLLADALGGVKENTGLLGDVFLGGAPNTLNQMSYGFSPVRMGRTDQGLMGAVNGMKVDPGIMDVAGVVGMAPGLAKGAGWAGREALGQINDAMLGGGNNVLARALYASSPKMIAPPRSMNMKDEDILIDEILKAAADIPPKSRVGLRMLPDDMPVPGAGSSLAPSKRWINGVPTNKNLSGTSSIGLQKIDPESVRQALRALGQIERSPYRTYYPGQSIGLIFGQTKRQGEDAGEWMIGNATLARAFKKLVD